jgi:hypothetical protein
VTVAFLVVAMLATAFDVAHAGDGPPRVWILPFEQHHPNADLEYLEEALPALLTVALSQSDNYSIVDRHHLNHVLAEQSLTLEGLTSPDAQLRVGNLLGATVMVTGSFARYDGGLLLTVRATDLERSVITVTAEASGSVSQLPELVGRLHRALARELGKELPDPGPDQIDSAPLSNLHFMMGLGHYYSVRLGPALSEFMLAAEDRQLSQISQLWLANTYMARREYVHAYLELSTLMHGGRGALSEKEISEKMRACEKHLNPEDTEFIRQLVERRLQIKKGSRR